MIRPKIKTPPNASQRGKLLSFRMQQPAKEMQLRKSWQNLSDFIVYLYLFQAWSAIIKYGIVVSGKLLKIFAQSQLDQLMKNRLNNRQFIVSIPRSVQITDRLRIKLPTNISSTISRQIPENQYLTFSQLCKAQITYIVDRPMSVQLPRSAQSLCLILQLSKCSVIVPQQSYTQMLTNAIENTDIIQTAPTY